MEAGMPVLGAAGFFVRDAFKVYGIYVVVVVLGTGILMFTADAIGFLSYSDRPGPGWYGFHPHISFADFEFLFGFVVFTTCFSVIMLLVPCAVLATVALRRFRVNAIVTVLILVPLFGFATYELLLASGWYIAISEVFVFVATTLSVPVSIAVSRPGGLRLGRLRLRAF